MAPPTKKKASRRSSQDNSEEALDPASSARLKAHHSQIKQEKDLIPLLPAPSSQIFSSTPAPLWEWSLHIDWPKFEKFLEESEEQKCDFSMYDGITKLISNYKKIMFSSHNEKKTKGGRKKKMVPVTKASKMEELAKHVVICPLCFKDKTCPLDEAVIGASGKTSNIQQHRDSARHAGVDFTPDKPKSSQTTIGQFATSQVVTRTGIRKEFRRLIYEFVNDCCLPASTVEKPQFRALLQYASAHGLQLKDSKAENMSRREISRMRLDSYEEFLFVVSDLGNKVRSAYEKLCKQQIPFATICHDIWNGPKCDILGVTIMFTDPRNCKVYRIPIGLAEIRGHTAADVSKLTHALLNAVGFSQSDLCASVNDNTASAVLAGKYIVGTPRTGKGGKCDMHKAELILKHATGLVQRSRNREVIDSNPDFIQVYSVAKGFAAWLMSSRAPQRFQNLCDHAARMGAIVIAIPLPNETRVSGCILLIVALLRNKWIMDDYAARTIGADLGFKRRYPSPHVWEILAQFEAILAPLKAVSLSLQIDAPGSSSASLLELYSARHVAVNMQYEEIECLPMTETEEQPIAKWDAKKTIDDLEESRKKIAFEDLEPQSRKLIRRVVKEYKTYVVHEKDEDAEKAMCCNPLLANIFEDFFKEMDAYTENDIARVKAMFVEDMVRKFSSNKVSRLGALFAKAAGNSQNVQNVETEPTEKVDGKPPAKKKKSKVASAFAKIREAREKKQQNLLNVSGRASQAGQESQRVEELRKACRECWVDFKKMCELLIDHRWEIVIKKYCTVEFSEESQKWGQDEWDEFKDACANNYYLAVARYFDVMKWWRDHANEYPFLFPSALIWLTKPPTNAFQERVFSSSTWFHSNKLMSNTLEKHNEMRTIEYQTRSLRKKIIEREKELTRRQQLDEPIQAGRKQDKTVIDTTQDNNEDMQGGDSAANAILVQDSTGQPSEQNGVEAQDDATSFGANSVQKETTNPHSEAEKEQGRQLRMAAAIKRATEELSAYNKKAVVPDLDNSGTVEASRKENSEKTQKAGKNEEKNDKAQTTCEGEEHEQSLMKFFAESDDPDVGDTPMEADDIIVVSIPVEDDTPQQDGETVEDMDESDAGLLRALREEIAAIQVESTGGTPLLSGTGTQTTDSTLEQYSSPSANQEKQGATKQPMSEEATGSKNADKHDKKKSRARSSDKSDDNQTPSKRPKRTSARLSSP